MNEAKTGMYPDEEACARSTCADKREKQPTIIEIHGQCVEMMRENLYLARCLRVAMLGGEIPKEEYPDAQNMRSELEVQKDVIGEVREELIRLIDGMGCHTL